MKKAIAFCLTVMLTLLFMAGEALAITDYTGTVQYTGSTDGAGAVMLMDVNSETILYQKNIDDQIEPASTTKIMTLILALENGNMDDIVTVSSAAAGQGGSTLIPKLSSGEKVVFKDLINGMMMASGNDAAVAVAEHLGETIDGFVGMMNAKASELNMAHTHFVTPHGMHDEAHVTTARDMAILTLYALKNPQFVEIVKQKSYTMPQTNAAGERVVLNTNKLLKEDEPYYYPYATGIKTGSTKTQYAGDCLVASATKDGMNLACLIFKTEENNPLRWPLAKDLFEWGFNSFKTVDVAALLKATEPVQASVKNASASDSGVLEFTLPGEGSTYVTLDKASVDGILNGTETITAEKSLSSDPLQAPIAKGDAVGTVTYKTGAGVTLYTGTWIASRDISEANAGPVQSGEPVVATQTPVLPDDVAHADNSGIWWWLLLPGALIAVVVIGLLTVNRHKRMRRRRHSRYGR